MLNSLLSSVIVKLLTQWGKALLAYLQDLARKAKRAAVQKKAIDKLEQDTQQKKNREERRQDEEDYLNS
jgi:hypothetical protein